MNIGIDIDNTLCNNYERVLNWSEIYNCSINGSNNKKDLNTLEMKDVFGWTQEQENEFWTRYIDVIAYNLDLRPFVKEVIDELRNEGHKIYLITSRINKLYPNILNITDEYIKKHNILCDNVIFEAINKLDVCKKNNISILVDDNVQVCCEVSKEIPVLCFKTLYNQNFTCFNTINVSNWIEVYIEIQRFLGNKEYNLDIFKNIK